MGWDWSAPSGVSFGSETYVTLMKSKYRINAYISAARGTGTTYYVKIRAVAQKGDTWGGTRNFHYYADGSWYSNVAFAENQSQTLYYTGSGGDANSGVYIRVAVSDQNSNTPSGGNSAVADGFYIPPVNTYTVTYSANNGTTATRTDTKISGTALSVLGCPFEKNGFRFVEWNTSADGTGTSYAAGSSYTDNSDVELYAQWEKSTPPLHINVSGTVIESDALYIRAGDDVCEIDSIYIRIGDDIIEV